MSNKIDFQAMFDEAMNSPEWEEAGIDIEIGEFLAERINESGMTKKHICEQATISIGKLRKIMQSPIEANIIDLAHLLEVFGYDLEINITKSQ